MSVTLRFAVVNITGAIVQTLERLGSSPSETWAELEARILANAGPGHTAIQMCEHDDCLLIDPAMARWNGTAFEIIPIVADAESIAGFRALGEAGGLTGAALDQYVADTVAFKEDGPAKHLARTHLFGEGDA